MKEIDIDSWDRKEHFYFFSNSDLPFYNTCFNLDITGLKDFSKEKNISFNNALIYLTILSLSKIKNFFYRIENNKVIEYDRIDPSFACLKNDEDLFRFITVEFDFDLIKFDSNVKKTIEKSNEYFDLSLLAKRTNFIFISSLPWIPFTSIDHTLNLNKDDSIPRISWGKYFEENNKTFIPYNIQVNHRLIDGIHIGRFYENLNYFVKDIIKKDLKS